ncbi:ATP-dependent DNA helicase [Trichonephila clavipes]|nr:ATP-dependent DNA helicase [Trichonephila clavipes]
MNDSNELLKLFKPHMHKLQNDNHAIVINPDKTPAGKHIRRFNAPIFNDIAGMMLIDKIHPEEINSIISAETPDPLIDQLLFDIVATNVIHGSCGNLNHLSLCMVNENCTQSFARNFTNDTITNVEEYPIYHQRNTDNRGQSFTKNVNNTDFGNHRVVPYSPLLSKTFSAHINVEFCSSVKSIKYICKYMNKGSDI